MENDNRARKALYMVLAILVAVVMWLYVDLEGVNGESYTRTKWFNDIPILYTNESALTEKGLMLLEDGTDHTVDLKIEGTRWNLAKLKAEDIRITVNLSSVAYAGKQMIAYEYAFANSKQAEGLRMKERKPTSAYVNVAELYSKDVEIYCEVVGNVAEGCYAGQLQMSHTMLELRGQQADVEPIAYAKVVLDIGQDAGTTVSRSLTYQLYDATDNLVDAANVHASASEIQVTLPVSINKELKLAMNFIETPGLREASCDYTIQPESITVSGDAELLRNIDKIVLNDFDLTMLTGETSTYSYPIVIPDGCKNLSGITQAILQISRRDYMEHTLSVNTFHFENLPEGKRAEILTTTLPVRVFGTVQDITGLLSEHLTANVDLGEYFAAAGSYTVPVELVSSFGDIGFIGAYEVQVRILSEDEEITEVVPEEPEEDQQETPEE